MSLASSIGQPRDRVQPWSDRKGAGADLSIGVGPP